MPSSIARRFHVHDNAVRGSLCGIRLRIPVRGRSVPTDGGEPLLGLLAGDSGRHANGWVRACPGAGLRGRCRHREDRDRSWG